MLWQIRCFAALRDATGATAIELDLPPGASVATLKAALEARYPPLAGRLATTRVAAGHEFLPESATLPPGAELALIPPVSGGSPGPELRTEEVTVGISAEPLSLDAVVAAVGGPDAGAIVTFSGTVRCRTAGRGVVALEYEVYAEMALDWLARIARRAKAAHDVARVAVVHRSGRVAVGEASVVIAVAAAHRAPAFAAAREVIEALKADVPIWKRELYADGAVWVGWGS